MRASSPRAGRLLSVPQLVSLENLSPEEHAAYEKLRTELYGLRARVAGDRDIPAGRSWHFNGKAAVVIICAELPAEQRGPLADPLDPNRTELHGIADADSLVELYGHIRAENPQLKVNYKTPSMVEKDDLTGHLVILGGVVWNKISEAGSPGRLESRLDRSKTIAWSQVKSSSQGKAPTSASTGPPGRGTALRRRRPAGQGPQSAQLKPHADHLQRHP